MTGSWPSSRCCAAQQLMTTKRREARIGSITNLKIVTLRYTVCRPHPDLFLLENRHVLAAFDVIVLGKQPEMIALDFFDYVRRVQADVLHGAASRHRVRAPVVLDDNQASSISQLAVQRRQHLVRIIPVMIGVKR